jgi:calcineurin-like phosphoesterase family protein
VVLAGDIGPTVVITHHAPSTSSIHPRVAGLLLNACFVSKARYLLDGERVRLWIHGHTHAVEALSPFAGGRRLTP